MATVNFLYRSNKPEAKLTLRLLFRLEGIDYVFAENTKISVSKDYYVNKDRKTYKDYLSPFNKVFSDRASSDIDIRNKNTKDLEIQVKFKAKLTAIETFILNEFEKYSPTEINKKWLTTKIDNFYNPKKNELIPTDLVSFFDYYLNYRRNELNPPSVMKYKTIQLKLKEFQIYRNRTILISDVTEIFMNEFIDYYKSKNYAHNTAQREFSFIKTVCLKAKFLGLEVSHQMEHLTIKAKEVKSIHLTFEELDKIDSTEFKSINNKEIKCTACSTFNFFIIYALKFSTINFI
jgi:hypothetical protein